MILVDYKRKQTLRWLLRILGYLHIKEAAQPFCYVLIHNMMIINQQIVITKMAGIMYIAVPADVVRTQSI